MSDLNIRFTPDPPILTQAFKADAKSTELALVHYSSASGDLRCDIANADVIEMSVLPKADGKCSAPGKDGKEFDQMTNNGTDYSVKALCNDKSCADCKVDENMTVNQCYSSYKLVALKDLKECGTPGNKPASGTSAGAVAGGVIGGLIAVALIGLVVFKRRQANRVRYAQIN